MNTADDLATRWVRSAARAAPATLRERLEEEWLADLGARAGWLARLRFGAGCQWATRAIAHEFAGAQLATTVAGADHALALHHPHGTSGPRRTLALFIIVGLHAAALFAITRTLRPPLKPADPVVTRAEVLTIHAPPLPAPPGPRTTLTGFETVTPLEPGGFKFQDDTGIVPPSYGKLGGINTDTPPVRRVNGGPGTGFPTADIYYPASAKRLGEHGVTAVRVCVDAAGRLTSSPAIADTSGSLRLDEGALRLARAGSGLYRPTTEDGQAVNSCYTFRVRFELRD
jgi:TonB family protein